MDILYRPPIRLWSATLLLTWMAFSCAPAQNTNSAPAENPEIFPQGDPAGSENFTGTAHVYGLIENDTVFTTQGGNVVFEPGARSHWHSHPAGQILIVLEGVGYHQIRGQAKETIRQGDVIKCPPNTDHWHGASADSSMTHIYLLPNTEKGIVNWQEPVTDEQFNNQ